MSCLFYKKKIFIIGPVCIKRGWGEALRASPKRHLEFGATYRWSVPSFSCPQLSCIIFYWTLFWNENSNTAREWVGNLTVLQLGKLLLHIFENLKKNKTWNKENNRRCQSATPEVTVQLCIIEWVAFSADESGRKECSRKRHPVHGGTEHKKAACVQEPARCTVWRRHGTFIEIVREWG